MPQAYEELEILKERIFSSTALYWPGVRTIIAKKTFVGYSLQGLFMNSFYEVFQDNLGKA